MSKLRFPRPAGTAARSVAIRATLVAVAAALCLAVGLPPARAGASGPAYGTYAWPVTGPVIRGFEPPNGPYGSGHRGIDIATPFASDMVAASDGVVAFAGWVAGSLYISIDHPDGVRTTYSWLSAVSVKKGQSVARGEEIGQTGHGHPDVDEPHLHFGARVGETYLDPMLLLEGADLSEIVHLAPLEAPGQDPPADRRRSPAPAW